jgi:multidrug efflux pump subunit AcrA (membrane-fusion protein)
MMKNFLPNPTLMALSAAAVLVIACGDGSSLPPAGAAQTSSPTASTTDIPLSATTSAQGAFSFVNLVASSPLDTAEPLLDGDAVLAVSDTDEPDPSV